jgi:hypothetical protein
MRGTTEVVKQILLEPTLYSIMQHEVERGLVNAPISLFVAFEDGQRFFDSQQQSTGEITPMDELAGVIRGSGKGLAVIVQTMQGLSRRLAPNLATKIMGRLGSHDDYARLGADLAMNPKQVEWARRRLKPGAFVVQVAEGDWREPFVVSVPLMRTRAVVSDEDAARSVRSLENLPTVPAHEYTNWQPDHLTWVESPARTEADDPAVASRADVSDAERRYMRAVVDNPGKPSSSLPKLAHISPKRAQKIRRRLVETGYLREHSVSTGKRGRAAIVLEPLEPALHAVRDMTGEDK